MKHLPQMLEALGLRIVLVGTEQVQPDDLGHFVQGGVKTGVSDSGLLDGCDVGGAVLIIEDTLCDEQPDEFLPANPNTDLN
jgi:hypothetical protein